jgi:hypothetical protein
MRENRVQTFVSSRSRKSIKPSYDLSLIPRNLREYPIVGSTLKM